MTNPETLLELIDAASNYVAQIRIATMVGDKNRIELAINEAERLLSVAMDKSEQAECDNARFTWLEEQAKKSRTGISFDYCRHVEDGHVVEKGFRFMRYHFLGERKDDIRSAIDICRNPPCE